MFQDHGVPGHKGWDCKTKHLPEGKVPRHDSQNDPQRIKPNITFAGITANPLNMEKGLGMLPKVIARQGTLVNLGPCLMNRFAHLHGDGAGQILLFLAEAVRQG